MPDKSGSRARNVGASVRQRLLNLAYACGQPLEGLLTRDALELAAAWRELTNQDIAARIVGCICQAAIGDALLHDGDRLGRALQQLLTHQPMPNHTAALDIGAKRWSLCHVDLYGDLLERNAGEKKSGAGHRFTPRHVIDSIVTAMCPQLNDLIDDPRGRRAALATRKNIGATRRWRCFTREQIAQRGCKLDISWPKDDSAEAADAQRDEPALVAHLLQGELGGTMAELRALPDEPGKDTDAVLNEQPLDEPLAEAKA